MENIRERRLLSVSDVAVYLNVSDLTIRKWRKAGQIPSLKVGGCVRFDMTEIENWIKNKK